MPRKRSSVLLDTINRDPLGHVALAMSLWPGDDERAVFLTPDEMSQWNEIYEPPENACWWFTEYAWRIEDSPRPIGLAIVDSDMTTPAGTDPWRVTSRFAWGPKFVFCTFLEVMLAKRQLL